MSTLRELQKAMASDILAADGGASGFILDDGISAADRLCIYRNTYLSTMIAALRITYPAVKKLVGDDFFESAALAFIEGQPPSSAYLNEYGAGFGDFLSHFPPAINIPYLADVARLEWEMSCATNAADAPSLDPAALGELSESEQENLRLIFHPATRLIALAYPADEIWRSVLGNDDDALRAIDIGTGPIHLLVQRTDNGVAIKRLTDTEWRFSRALAKGERLADALNEDADLVGLLGEHIACGRFSGFVTALEYSREN